MSNVLNVEEGVDHGGEKGHYLGQEGESEEKCNCERN